MPWNSYSYAFLADTNVGEYFELYFLPWNSYSYAFLVQVYKPIIDRCYMLQQSILGIILSKQLLPGSQVIPRLSQWYNLHKNSWLSTICTSKSSSRGYHWRPQLEKPTTHLSTSIIFSTFSVLKANIFQVIRIFHRQF